MRPGQGGNAYAWKTIPSEIDIARGLLEPPEEAGRHSPSRSSRTITGSARPTPLGFARVAGETGHRKCKTTTIVPPKTEDFAPLVAFS